MVGKIGQPDRKEQRLVTRGILIYLIENRLERIGRRQGNGFGTTILSHLGYQLASHKWSIIFAGFMPPRRKVYLGKIRSESSSGYASVVYST